MSGGGEDGGEDCEFSSSDDGSSVDERNLWIIGWVVGIAVVEDVGGRW